MPLSAPKHFQFINPGNLDLADELSRPFDHISVTVDNFQKPMNLIFWRSCSNGIKIWCEMRDAAWRVEIGILHFDLVTNRNDDVPGFWSTQLFTNGLSQIKKIEKMVIAESGVTGESGIVFTLDSGRELLIVANGFPCFIAIQGIDGFNAPFQPEYELLEYKRIPLERGNIAAQ